MLNVPQIVVSNVSKHHSYFTALAAQRAGYLKAFITSVYFKPDHSFSRLLISLADRFRGLQRPLQRLYERYHEDLDVDCVRVLLFPEFLAYAMRMVPLLSHYISDYQWMAIKNDLFDKQVIQYLGRCDIFHSFEACALFSFRQAKDRGAVTVLDQPIMHPVTVQSILGQEYLRLGLPVHEAFKDQRMLYRKVQEYELADYILVPSQKIADDFVAKGVSGAKMRVIPYGASPVRFYKSKKEDNRFRILFVGTLCIRKGVHYLLEAFKSLKLKGSELVLVGAVEPDFKLILTRYEGYYIHIPHMPQTELNRWYNNASVFVLPSLAEGSAMVVYEAMGCGIPAIVTENCGSVVRDMQDGLVIRSQDLEMLKDRILFLYEHPKSAEDMGFSGMAYAKQFTWERYMSCLIDTWDNIWRENRNSVRLPCE